jgi:uncharacterized protein
MRSKPSFADEVFDFKMQLDVKARSIGPFKDEVSALAFLRDRLALALKPLAICQFGSRALGDADENSDFDLLVVLADGLPEDAYSPRRAAEPVAGCGLGFNIVPCSLSEFHKERDVCNSLVHNAITLTFVREAAARPVRSD